MKTFRQSYWVDPIIAQGIQTLIWNGYNDTSMWLLKHIVLQCVVNHVQFTQKLSNHKKIHLKKKQKTHFAKWKQVWFCFKDILSRSGFRWHFLYLCMLWMRCIITLFFTAHPTGCLLSSQVCLHGKVNLIFCGKGPRRIIQYNIYSRGVCSPLIWRARLPFAF